MNDINSSPGATSPGATTRREFIQRAGVGLVAVEGLPAVLRNGVASGATGASKTGRSPAPIPAGGRASGSARPRHRGPNRAGVTIDR